MVTKTSLIMNSDFDNDKQEMVFLNAFFWILMGIPGGIHGLVAQSYVWNLHFTLYARTFSLISHCYEIVSYLKDNPKL